MQMGRQMDFAIFRHGQQIDRFIAQSNDDAIGWVESMYPCCEFGLSTICLYRMVNGAGIHVASFAILY
jgi:hypothetical protein